MDDMPSSAPSHSGAIQSQSEGSVLVGVSWMSTPVSFETMVASMPVDVTMTAALESLQQQLSRSAPTCLPSGLSPRRLPPVDDLFAEWSRDPWVATMVVVEPSATLSERALSPPSTSTTTMSTAKSVASFLSSSSRPHTAERPHCDAVTSDLARRDHLLSQLSSSLASLSLRAPSAFIGRPTSRPT